jgi:lysyl-tRNA synthetase class 2
LPHFDSEYEEKLYQDRLASLNRIAEIGEKLGLSYAEATFPNSFPFTHTVPELRALGDPRSAEELEATPIPAAIAGRLMAIRAQGKAGFAPLQQGGERIQIYVRKDDVGELFFELYKNLHIGDHIGVRGTLMRTRTGELTLKAQPVDGLSPLVFLSKATLALPDKYHGLEDVELRYRQRYVDLIMNSGTRPGVEPATPGAPSSAGQDAPTPAGTGNSGQGGVERGDNAGAPFMTPSSGNMSGLDVRAVFIKRAQVLRAIRKFFDARDYIEVETPMLHSVAGGATARPFTTHHNALDMPLYLRIAPELFLKRLVVGGLDRVYEINRNFRNEGVSTRHNPEFTMLEFYQAYANYHDLMDLTEELIKFVAMEVNGSTITHFNGNEIDLSKWQKLSMREAIIKWWPKQSNQPPAMEDFALAGTLADRFQSAFLAIQSHRSSQGDDVDPIWIEVVAVNNKRIADVQMMFEAYALALRKFPERLGRIIAEAFELLAEEHLIQPTIIYDFPLAVSPLSKIKPSEPDWVERFEFYIGGFEVGNAFSELNDAADQERRFEAQLEEKARGDEEAMEMDEDYVRALGYGLPPTAGEGIGIDRLTMLLTGSRSIRDVILFPLMRPQGKAPATEEDHGESAE